MDLLCLCLQGMEVFSQRIQTVKVGIVQNGFDLLQFHAQSPVKQNLLQPIHLWGIIKTVAVFRYPFRVEQPQFVVPAQGAGGYSGQIRQLLNGVFRRIPPYAPIIILDVLSMSRTVYGDFIP